VSPRGITVGALGVLALLVVVLAAVVGTRGGGTTGAPLPSPTGPSTVAPAPPAALRTYTAAEAGRAFLDGYVDEDGQVVRPDQGGDTVSEGQAYAMLVAVGLGDAKTFARAWNWTRENLQRPDGLLSWRWRRAASSTRRRPRTPTWTPPGPSSSPASSSGAPSTPPRGWTSDGRCSTWRPCRRRPGRILTAGQWATTEPYAYNPSYASPGATAVLAAASGDPRWTELAEGSRAVTAALLSQAPLPPDWAQVRADGTVEAMPGAMGRGAERAVRLRRHPDADPLRRVLRPGRSRPGRGRRRTPGPRRGQRRARPGRVTGRPGRVGRRRGRSGCGGGRCRGRRPAVEELVDADHLAQSAPSYYGAAWAALGRFMLTDDVLGGCPPVPATSGTA
jgi:endoglucanase